MPGPGRVVRLATRGSPLARWQADRVADLLREVGVASAVVVIETEGDRRSAVPLDQLGGRGVFVREVQTAVARGDADAAVHSAKDLPAAPELSVPGLVIGAAPERGDPRDLLVGGTVDGLRAGSLVATGSARRLAQLANLRPDLTFTGLRGNMASRLHRAGTGDVTAVVVAKAATDRLGWTPPPGMTTEVLEPTTLVPQVGQGALAVECREVDTDVVAALATIDDPDVRPLVEAERAFLAELGGGCTLPVGACARWTDDGHERITLTGMLASADGRVVLRQENSDIEPLSAGRTVARFLLDRAGGDLLFDGGSP